MEIRLYSEENTPGIDEFLRERVELVVGRFADRIGHVDVHLSLENTHDDKEHSCTMNLKLLPRGVIHVGAKSGSSEAAIVKAVHRAESALAKMVDRGHRSRNVRHNGGGLRHLSEMLETVSSADDEDE